MEYNTLKTAIQNTIKENGNNEITGDILQQALLAMINALGAGMQFMGIANPSTNPGTPDSKQFYIAYQEGDYEYFEYSVGVGELVIFTWEDQGVWEIYPIVQPPLFISLEYDRDKGGLDIPYEISEDDWNAAVDAFMSGRGVRFIFTSAVQTYYANLLSISNDAYMLCMLIDDDDTIRTILIQQEV